MSELGQSSAWPASGHTSGKDPEPDPCWPSWFVANVPYLSFAHAVGIYRVGSRAERPLSNVTAVFQTFIRRDGPSVFDPLVPFSMLSWLCQIGRMD